jgi:hypothetical protein
LNSEAPEAVDNSLHYQAINTMRSSVRRKAPPSPLNQRKNVRFTTVEDVRDASERPARRLISPGFVQPLISEVDIDYLIKNYGAISPESSRTEFSPNLTEEEFENLRDEVNEAAWEEAERDIAEGTAPALDLENEQDDDSLFEEGDSIKNPEDEQHLSENESEDESEINEPSISVQPRPRTRTPSQTVQLSQTWQPGKPIRFGEPCKWPI